MEDKQKERAEVGSKFLDWIRQTVGLKSDYALCKEVGFLESTASHIRHGRQKVSPRILFKISDRYNIDINILRDKLKGETECKTDM